MSPRGAGDPGRRRSFVAGEAVGLRFPRSPLRSFGSASTKGPDVDHGGNLDPRGQWHRRSKERLTGRQLVDQGTTAIRVELGEHVVKQQDGGSSGPLGHQAVDGQP